MCVGGCLCLECLYVCVQDILVGGVLISDIVSSLGGTRITFTLPPGTGVGLPVIAQLEVSDELWVSDGSVSLSYAPPEIRALLSSACVGRNTSTVEDCPREGGTMLT
jgi:hypothetical protein